MAQQDIPVRANVAYVAPESPYGTPGSFVRDQLWNETVDVSGFAQTEISNDDARVSLFDHQFRIRGYRSSSKLKFKRAVKVPAVQLTTGATPTTSVEGIYLKALMGTETAAAGSAVATATSQTSIVVTAGDGAKLPAGTWALVGVGGVLEPARVSNRVTDSLTFSLGLSATTATSQLVVNTYCYTPSNVNSQSLSFQFGYNLQGAGSADAQWQCLGCTGDFGFEFARDKIPMMDLDLAVASPSDPSALSLVTTQVADSMSLPLPPRSGTLYCQPASTAAKTASVHWESYSIKINNGMSHVPTNDSSGFEGTCNVMRSGVVRPYAVITIKCRYDLARHTDWVNQTPQQIVMVLSLGTGTTKRFFILDAPNAIPMGLPKVSSEGGRLVMTCEFECAQDNITGASATGDVANAPLRIAIG